MIATNSGYARWRHDSSVIGCGGTQPSSGWPSGAQRTGCADDLGAKNREVTLRQFGTGVSNIDELRARLRRTWALP